MHCGMVATAQHCNSRQRRSAVSSGNDVATGATKTATSWFSAMTDGTGNYTPGQVGIRIGAAGMILGKLLAIKCKPLKTVWCIGSTAKNESG